MKKLLALLLVFALLLSFTACGGKQPTGVTENSSDTASTPSKEETPSVPDEPSTPSVPTGTPTFLHIIQGISNTCSGLLRTIPAYRSPASVRRSA